MEGELGAKGEKRHIIVRKILWVPRTLFLSRCKKNQQAGDPLRIREVALREAMVGGAARSSTKL